MAERYLTDPNLWNANVEHSAAVGEQITTPYFFDALDGLDLSRGVRLLDVATGTGALAREAACRGADVLAIDSSPATVAYLAARLTYVPGAFPIRDATRCVAGPFAYRHRDAWTVLLTIANNSPLNQGNQT